MDYPQNDTDFEEVTITKVTPQAEGWEIERSDGFCFWVPVDGCYRDLTNPTPAVGDTARFYGKGLGFMVRGLFINGKKVFYRTEAEQKEKDEHEKYGTIPQDVIDIWDAGDTFWSIEMGGFGPGYEQALQHCAIEMLRYMIQKKVDHSSWDEEGGLRDISKEMTDPVGNLFEYGFSGAQWGAALSLAAKIYKYGPREFQKSIPKDRRIQVSSHWPRLKAVA